MVGTTQPNYDGTCTTGIIADDVDTLQSGIADQGLMEPPHEPGGDDYGHRHRSSTRRVTRSEHHKESVAVTAESERDAA